MLLGVNSQNWLTLGVALLGFVATISAQLIAGRQRASDRKHQQWVEWRATKLGAHTAFLRAVDELERRWLSAWASKQSQVYEGAYAPDGQPSPLLQALAEVELFGSAETITRARRLSDWFALALRTLFDALGPGDPDNPADPDEVIDAEAMAFDELRAAYVAAVRKELMIAQDWAAPLTPWTEG